MTTRDGSSPIGLDDLWAHRFDLAVGLQTLPARAAAIVLSHNPDTVDLAGWGSYSGWVLAGHTHGGQCKPPFLPPPLLPVRNRRYTRGEFELSGRRRLYISRGVGHLQRVRFNVRPEITVFRMEEHDLPDPPPGFSPRRHRVSLGNRSPSAQPASAESLATSIRPVKPAPEDLPHRRPVWEALSDLFLDTDPSLGRSSRVSILAASPYSLGELQEILVNEVYPICRSNLSSVAGEWAGFDAEWLESSILRQLRSPRRWRWLSLGRFTVPWSSEWRHTKAAVLQQRSRRGGGS